MYLVTRHKNSVYFLFVSVFREYGVMYYRGVKVSIESLRKRALRWVQPWCAHHVPQCRNSINLEHLTVLFLFQFLHSLNLCLLLFKTHRNLTGSRIIFLPTWPRKTLNVQFHFIFCLLLEAYKLFWCPQNRADEPNCFHCFFFNAIFICILKSLQTYFYRNWS